MREETIPSTAKGRTHSQLCPVQVFSRQRIYLVYIPKMVRRSRYESSLPIRILSVDIKLSPLPLGDTLSDEIANQHVSV